MCTPGRFSNESGAATCGACSKLGLAQPSEGGKSCEACPRGEQSNAQGTCSLCVDLPARSMLPVAGSCDWECVQPYTKIGDFCAPDSDSSPDESVLSLLGYPSHVLGCPSHVRAPASRAGGVTMDVALHQVGGWCLVLTLLLLLLLAHGGLA
eukprot:7088620-Prymnesium_polylepis.1